MHPLKLIIIVMLLNLTITLSSTTDYNSQYNITNQWLTLQENINDKSLSIRTQAEEGDLIQQTVGGILSIIEGILVIPKFVFFFMGILLTPIMMPLSYSTYATNNTEKIIWGVIGLIMIITNLLMVYTFYKLIVNKDDN